MPSVVIAGGGLAGLASAAALGSLGYQVDLHEARPFLGGRATSYALPSSNGDAETIDNCQHILLRCCVNLLDLYSRLGVLDSIEFAREFVFIEPGGRRSTLSAGLLPAPLHFTESFLRLKYLSLSEKLALTRALLAIKQQRLRADLDQITMAEWLASQGQPQRVVNRFWRQILVSAVNEDLEIMSARWGFQVFWLGFLCSGTSHQMGVPAVPLGELYCSDGWRSLPNVRFHLKSPVRRITPEGAETTTGRFKADFYISALPWDRAPELSPAIRAIPMESSPITGVHLWFDRPVVDVPHATLLDRTIQWMFNKDDGRYVQLVISASRSLSSRSRSEIIDLATAELSEFFPEVKQATLIRGHVVKEMHATFSASCGLPRPTAVTSDPSIFLAGDWTDTGWPSTMEGAVRSGYLAAEAVVSRAGDPHKFLIPDIA